MKEYNQVRVQVAGKFYQLSGFEKPDYFMNLAESTDRRIDEIVHQNPQLDSESAAVVVALSLTDELIKARQEVNMLRQQLESMQKHV